MKQNDYDDREPILVPHMDAREVGKRGPNEWCARHEGVLSAVTSAVHLKLDGLLQDDHIFRMGGIDRLHTNLCGFLHRHSTSVTRGPQSS